MKKAVFSVSVIALYVLLITVPVLAIFPVFFIVWSVEKSFNTDHFYRKYIVIGTAFGLLTEVLAILDNLDAPPEEKILFHPDPGIDLLLGIGFYFWIAVIWAVFVKRYSFSAKSVFIIGGIWGIIVEQNMNVLLAPFQHGVIGFLFYGFVFLVYGPCMAIPVVLLDVDTLPRKERTLKNGILAFILLFGAYILAGIYMAIIITILGIT
ncbi:MAG: hypothetical protein PVF58_04505 [Candidatus Methanofastidiosia archaeon]|jgi:hypothetical protein